MVLWESWLWQKTGSDAVLIEATGRIVSDWLPVFGNDNVVLESIHTAESMIYWHGCSIRRLPGEALLFHF